MEEEEEMHCRSSFCSEHPRCLAVRADDHAALAVLGVAAQVDIESSP